MQDTLSVPVVRDAAIAAAREVMAIAAAYGHPITGQTPEDRIARSSKIPHRPSILQDLDMGRAMEIDALFAVPLQLAREAGVPTPVLDLSVALATRAAIAAGLHHAAR
jgi:2-dehydropantoate 2-reductase